MNLSWIIQGPPQSAWSYYMQIRLFAKYLPQYGYQNQVVTLTSPATDVPEMLLAINKFQTDYLINIGDIHFPDLPKLTGLPVIFIVTNGTGIAPTLKPIKNSIFACTTHFAQTLYAAADISPTPYLPHGFDPSIFHPGSRQQARRRLGWKHSGPTVLMLGTNYSLNPLDSGFNPAIDRKNWLGGLQAFAMARKHHPNLKLYLHTNALGAINLPQAIKSLNLSSSVILANTTNMMPQSHIADLYRASNLLLFPSIGESFGVPLIEAQACGIPVIATKTGPMTELVLSGSAVKANPHPAFPAWATPDPALLAQALLEWVKHNDKAAVSHRIQSFSVKNIIEDHFLTILKEAIHGNR
jgi:glycosyltransferase involved in cell wall biosynthesis